MKRPLTVMHSWIVPCNVSGKPQMWLLKELRSGLLTIMPIQEKIRVNEFPSYYETIKP